MSEKSAQSAGPVMAQGESPKPNEAPSGGVALFGVLPNGLAVRVRGGAWRDASAIGEASQLRAELVAAQRKALKSGPEGAAVRAGGFGLSVPEAEIGLHGGRVRVDLVCPGRAAYLVVRVGKLSPASHAAAVRLSVAPLPAYAPPAPKAEEPAKA
jgi:hypothetical protein